MKTKKAKHTLIVVIVCVCITVLTTLGVGFYNYYGYVAYKTQFLDEYFDIHDKKTISNQEKIENALKWESAYYIKNPGKITFRDPGVNPYPTKTPIGSEKLDGDVLNVNAYFDGETLHLPNYFDVNFYSQYVDFSNAENAEEKAKINYYFFFSNIMGSCFTPHHIIPFCQQFHFQSYHSHQPTCHLSQLPPTDFPWKHRESYSACKGYPLKEYSFHESICIQHGDMSGQVFPGAVSRCIPVPSLHHGFSDLSV